MSEWLVFDSEAAAMSAVRQIDAAVGNPRPGRNAATGKPEPDKVGTVTWAIPIQRMSDGKWGFPRCPKADPSRRFTVEQWDPLIWFPSDESAGPQGPQG